ncbi:MAG TPA: DUF1003 domain-containing protein [Ktedonobacteraceae bacterium]|jgi:uncharacterized membrane protein|nr:DUF1003 domain-containing protein [Ktedonobacteraceae bacterium]
MDITPGVESVVPKHAHGEGHAPLLGGIHVKFPTFKHNHPAIINVNEVAAEQLTAGQKIADTVASTVGSWRFIIIQSCILAVWLALNITGIVYRWDPYPFILLNLALSFQAAYAAPFVMMSQNRQAEKDRLTAQNDYICDTKGEEEIRHIMEHLDHQDDLILQIVKRLEEQHTEMREQIARLDPALVKRLAIEMQQVVKEQEAP